MRFTTIFFRTVVLGLILSTLFLACDKPDPKPSTFTVTFDTQSGSKIDPQKVKSGQKATRPTDPTLQGYVFSGWYRDKAGTQVFDFTTATITADITLYARWVARTFTVTFDTQSGIPAVPSQNIKSGQKATRPTDPTLQGYVFSGWYRDKAGTQVFDFTTATITADITLYARWVARTFTVTFDTQSGIPAVPSQNIKSGQKATRPVTDPTLQGYVFSGWYRDQAGTQVFDFSTTTITADITLYARWVARIFTVTFDTQSGIPAVPSQNIKSGQKATRPVTDPTLQGYVFLDWYRDQAGTQVFNFSTTTITANITLYAGWGVTIPDANFRERLKIVVPNAFKGDLLNPRHNAVTGLTALEVSSSQIKSLSGIAYFTALTSFRCRDNPLDSLDVSANTKLTTLDCSSSALDKLDVSANTTLTTLDCSNNPLGSLDVSSNPDLTQLTCYNNSLQSLDVSASPLLTSLDCSNNSLTSLDLRGMRSVIKLIIKPTLGGSNSIVTLSVHDAVKNHAKIKNAKDIRGSSITIKTYSAAAGSTSYTLTCADYNPSTEQCIQNP